MVPIFVFIWRIMTGYNVFKFPNYHLFLVCSLVFPFPPFPKQVVHSLVNFFMKDVRNYSLFSLFPQQVVSIIESRAQTMDMTVNRFYDLLFSYHTIKSDYRKAATTMYEQAVRLQTEMHGLKSLQKQVNSFHSVLSGSVGN